MYSFALVIHLLNSPAPAIRPALLDGCQDRAPVRHLVSSYEKIALVPRAAAAGAGREIGRAHV